MKNINAVHLTQNKNKLIMPMCKNYAELHCSDSMQFIVFAMFGTPLITNAKGI